MNKKILTGFAAVFIAVLAIAGVFAYRGDFTVKNPQFSDERHEAMQEAFESINYSMWYDLMTVNGRNPRIVQVVTENNFAEFVETHQSALEGNTAHFKEFRESLGLGLGQMKHGNGRAFARGFRKGNNADFGNGQRNGNCFLAE